MIAILDLPLRQPSATRADWHEDPLIMLGRTAPYLVVPASTDPESPNAHLLLREAGIVELPRLAGTDLPFDRMAVVRELDPRGIVRQLLPELRRGPVPCSDEVARLVLGPVLFDPKVLDLVVYGVDGIKGRPPTEGESAIWYPLLIWRW